jgi:hypothetical protein
VNVDVPENANPFNYPIQYSRTEKHILFVNYHITHHAGTALWYFAREQPLVSDGMNAMHNIDVGLNTNITKMFYFEKAYFSMLLSFFFQA